MTQQQAKKALYAVMLVTLLSVSGIALPYPIFAPLFSVESHHTIAQFFGLNKSLLFSAILAAYPLGMFIGSAFIGPMSDEFGRKKTLLFTSTFSALSYLISALAIIEESFLLLLLSRFVTGLCEGNIAIGRAILTDLSVYIDKTKAFSYLYAVSYAGWLLGPLIGGYSSSLGFEFAFFIASSVTFASLIAIYRFIPETNIQQREKPNFRGIASLAIKQNSFHLLAQSNIRRFFLMYICLTTGLMIFYQYFPMWLTVSFAYNSETLAHVTVMQTIAMILVSTLVVTRIKRKLGIPATIYIGVIILSLLLLGAPHVSRDEIYWYFFATGASIALYNGLVPVFASDRYAHLPQGKLMGMLTSTYCFSGVLAAISAGLVSMLSVTHSIQFGGVLLIIALLQFTIMQRKPIVVDEKTLSVESE